MNSRTSRSLTTSRERECPRSSRKRTNRFRTWLCQETVLGLLFSVRLCSSKCRAAWSIVSLAAICRSLAREVVTIVDLPVGQVKEA